MSLPSDDRSFAIMKALRWFMNLRLVRLTAGRPDASPAGIPPGSRQWVFMHFRDERAGAEKCLRLEFSIGEDGGVDNFSIGEAEPPPDDDDEGPDWEEVETPDA